jgi:hypothetical protein
VDHVHLGSSVGASELARRSQQVLADVRQVHAHDEHASGIAFDAMF